MALSNSHVLSCGLVPLLRISLGNRIPARSLAYHITFQWEYMMLGEQSVDVFLTCACEVVATQRRTGGSAQLPWLWTPHTTLVVTHFVAAAFALVLRSADHAASYLHSVNVRCEETAEPVTTEREELVVTNSFVPRWSAATGCSAVPSQRWVLRRATPVVSRPYTKVGNCKAHNLVDNPCAVG